MARAGRASTSYVRVDQVPSGDGSSLTVASVFLTQRVETVYNFAVDDFRSYFVGESGAWVHNCKFKLPKKVRSVHGVTGKFRNKRYNYRIDTNPGAIAPGEGGFHIHIFRRDVEVAKVAGKGAYAKTHGGTLIRKPSELPKTVRNDINRLVEHVQKNLD